jgi:hypothetical protein
MATNRKVSAISGGMTNSRRWLAPGHLLAIGVIAAGTLASGSAFAGTPWNQGCAAPAPEIGAGVLGAMLSVAAVKFFRRRTGE